jgi:hypothetical protein
MDDLYNEEELKEEGMKVVSDDAVVDDDVIVEDPVVDDVLDETAEGAYGLNGRPKEDSEDPEGLNDGLAEFESYVAEANEWEL